MSKCGSSSSDNTTKPPSIGSNAAEQTPNPGVPTYSVRPRHGPFSTVSTSSRFFPGLYSFKKRHCIPGNWVEGVDISIISLVTMSTKSFATSTVMDLVDVNQQSLLSAFLPCPRRRLGRELTVGIPSRCWINCV